MKIKNKESFIYALAICILMLFVVLMAFLTKYIRKYDDGVIKQSGYVYNILNKLSIPVNNDGVKIIRPYTDNNIKKVKDFYDYLKDENEQENAIIYFQDTYIQSNGVAYSNGDKFDVIAVLDGEVEEVKEDEFLGNIVTIKHDGMLSVYQGLSEVNVKKKDFVSQGTIIGKAGTSNINADLDNHLYFEMIIDDKYVNPEDYYDKEL